MPFDPPKSPFAIPRMRPRAHIGLTRLTLGIWLAGATGSAWAQSAPEGSPPAVSFVVSPGEPSPSADPAAQQAPAVPAESETKKPHDFSFIALPIPVSNPTIGSGFAVGVGALYKAGKSEKPWVSGLAFLYTNTESWALALVQKAYIGDDKLRLTGAVGGGEFHIDYYGIGPDAGDRDVSVPITQDAIFVGGQALMRVAPNLYAGLQYRYIDMSTSLHVDPPPFPDLDLPPAELESVSSALGLSAEYDTRDNEYQPSSGLYATGVWLVADKAFGSDRDYSRAEARINGYHRMDAKSVLAWRGSLCVAGDSAPFYDICNYGSQNDLRGYASGQYRDRAMVAAQVEYRRKLFGRFGGVVFAGVGGIGPDFASVTDAFLPAAGVGVRFEASRKYGVNVGIDYAVGKDSDAVYFRIGEAF
jgi:hypothetical protein